MNMSWQLCRNWMKIYDHINISTCLLSREFKQYRYSRTRSISSAFLMNIHENIALGVCSTDMFFSGASLTCWCINTSHKTWFNYMYMYAYMYILNSITRLGQWLSKSINETPQQRSEKNIFHWKGWVIVLIVCTYL